MTRWNTTDTLGNGKGQRKNAAILTKRPRNVGRQGPVFHARVTSKHKPYIHIHQIVPKFVILRAFPHDSTEMLNSEDEKLN